MGSGASSATGNMSSLPWGFHPDWDTGELAFFWIDKSSPRPDLQIGAEAGAHRLARELLDVQNESMVESGLGGAGRALPVEVLGSIASFGDEGVMVMT